MSASSIENLLSSKPRRDNRIEKLARHYRERYSFNVFPQDDKQVPMWQWREVGTVPDDRFAGAFRAIWPQKNDKAERIVCGVCATNDTCPDVDLDSPEARYLAPYILPETATYGRPSSQRSHWLYDLTSPVDAETYRPGSKSWPRQVILELLTSAEHVVTLPGSVHKSGELVDWTGKNRVRTKISGDALKTKCDILAGVSIIAHHFEPGNHDVPICILTKMLRQYYDSDVDEIEHIVTGICEFKQTDANEWLKKVRETFERLEAGKPVPGIDKAREVLGADAEKFLHYIGAMNSWPTPEDIFTFADVPSFPTHLLPATIGDRVADVANRVSCPVEAAAFHGICQIAFAAGSRFCVRPSFNDDEWNEPLIFYGCVAMESGTAKTPALTQMLQPLDAMQRKAEKNYQAELEIYSAMTGNERRGVPVPAREFLRIDNFTVPALMRAQADVPSGVYVVCDELSQVFLSSGQYSSTGQSDQEPILCQMHGGGMVTVARKGKGGSDYLESSQLQLCGGIQPGRLTELINDNNEALGLVARFSLMAMPKPMLRKYQDNKVDAKARAAYERQVMRLRVLGQGDDKIALTLSKDARPVFARFVQMTYDQQHISGETWQKHLGKYTGFALRLAGVFHLASLDLPDPTTLSSYDRDIEEMPALTQEQRTISRETIMKVIEFIEAYLKPHARAIYQVVDQAQGEKEGRKIAERFILRVDDDGKMIKPPSITVRDVRRANLSKLKDARKIGAGLDWLAAMQWGKLIHHKNSTQLKINPLVYEREWQ